MFSRWKKTLLLILPAVFLGDIQIASAGNMPLSPFVVVLGIAQDAGFPQAGTKKNAAWSDHTLRRKATCLAIVDPRTGQRWMLDATPDFKEQLYELDQIAPHAGRPGLSGIFLTHGHMGHYTGLIHLGREAIGASGVPVYAMPRMKKFLETNGPWELLVRLKNIVLRPLSHKKSVQLASDLSVTPFLVPHRDEYTETVGFEIKGPRRSIIFIPDIDKWEKWDAKGGNIEKMIKRTDYALLDGTFFKDGEIPGRAMSQIPHPFIEESMKRFSKLSAKQKSKIHFIHLNRTNPAIQSGNKAVRMITDKGFRLAKPLQRIAL